MKDYHVLAINPGSTSMKFAVYKNEDCILKKTYTYTPEQITRFSAMIEQLDMRRETVNQFIQESGFDVSLLDAVVGRGGVVPPLKSGAYRMNDLLLDRLANRPAGQHASNLGGILAYELANKLGKPAYIYDAVSVSETKPLATLTGVKGLVRQSRLHALNVRATAFKEAKKLGRPLENVNLLIAHLGGGVTMAMMEKGRMVDILLDGEGPMSPERAGRCPLSSLITYCMTNQIDYKTLMKRIRGGGGFVALLGTTSALEVEKRVAEGDEFAALVLETFCYQVAKSIGEMATVTAGKVDRIVLTGALANSQRMVDWITQRVRFIAPVDVIPGENEMESLAMGTLRVLKGEEEAHVYDEATDSWDMDKSLQGALEEYKQMKRGKKVEKLVLMMSEKDSVAIVLRAIQKGEKVPLPDGRVLEALNDIPRSHKIAIMDVALGEPVIRYGDEIGYATQPIKAGEWIHVHNMDAEKIM